MTALSFLGAAAMPQLGDLPRLFDEYSHFNNKQIFTLAMQWIWPGLVIAGLEAIYFEFRNRRVLLQRVKARIIGYVFRDNGLALPACEYTDASGLHRAHVAGLLMCPFQTGREVDILTAKTPNGIATLAGECLPLIGGLALLTMALPHAFLAATADADFFIHTLLTGAVWAILFVVLKFASKLRRRATPLTREEPALHQLGETGDAQARFDRFVRQMYWFSIGALAVTLVILSVAVDNARDAFTSQTFEATVTSVKELPRRPDAFTSRYRIDLDGKNAEGGAEEWKVGRSGAAPDVKPGDVIRIRYYPRLQLAQEDHGVIGDIDMLCVSLGFLWLAATALVCRNPLRMRSATSLPKAG